MNVAVEARESLGRSACKRLRQDGFYPAVVYGRELAATSVKIEARVLDAFMRTHAVRTQPFDLELAGKEINVLVKDIKRSTSTNQIEHIDFFVIEQNKPITLSIPLRLLNAETAKGIQDGGVLDHSMHEIEIVVLPKNIPSHLELDIEALEIGASIHLSSLPLPKGCELSKPIDEEHDPLLVSIQQPREEEPEEPVVEEGAEGEEGETEADAEGDDQAEEEAEASSDEAEES